MLFSLKNNKLDDVVDFLEKLSNNGKSYSKFLEELMVKEQLI